MKSLVDALREIIDDKFICNQHNSAVLELIEEAEGSTSGTTTLQKMVGEKKILLIKSDDTSVDTHPFLIKGPKFPSHSIGKQAKEDFQSQFNGLRKRCDYLLFCEIEEVKGTISTYVFAIELKSGVTGNWIRQVHVGLALAKYLIAFVEVRDNINFNLKAHHYKLHYRGLLFTTKANRTTKKPKLRNVASSIYKEHPVYQYKYTRSKAGEKHFLSTFIA
ncbi:MAG: hypothetical protein AB8E82_12435 [Aureispira sp.]